VNTRQIEIAHLLRQGAKMVRELRDLKRIDARFAERLEQDYNEALAYIMNEDRDLAELRELSEYIKASDVLDSLRGMP